MGLKGIGDYSPGRPAMKTWVELRASGGGRRPLVFGASEASPWLLLFPFSRAPEQRHRAKRGLPAFRSAGLRRMGWRDPHSGKPEIPKLKSSPLVGVAGWDGQDMCARVVDVSQRPARRTPHGRPSNQPATHFIDDRTARLGESRSNRARPRGASRPLHKNPPCFC